MIPRYELGGETIEAAPIRQSSTDCNQLLLRIDGAELQVQLERHSDNKATLTINGKRFDVYVAQDDEKLFVHLNGRSYELLAISEFAAAAGGGSGSGQIKAPMPGVVLECSVAEGDTVSEGQSLMMIESMKLQTEITAPIGGTVASLSVEAGQSFDKGAVLIAITADETASGEALAKESAE